MKSPKNTESFEGLPPELAALFQNAKKLSPAQMDELGKAGDEWQNDPVERADYHKALFVTAIKQAMEAQKVSQSDLAKKWGHSRQYLSKLLKQDKQTNFTIETMVELTILLGIGFRIDTDKEAKIALSIVGGESFSNKFSAAASCSNIIPFSLSSASRYTNLTSYNAGTLTA